MPPPTAERLKVRCYRCNQLLAVAPTKAGSVVACPRCKAELLIPRPEPQHPAEETADPSVVVLNSATFQTMTPETDSPPMTAGQEGSASASFLDEIAAVIPPEVAAMRPEDLRVEAEFFETLTREPAPPQSAEPFLFPGASTAGDVPPAPEGDEPSPVAPQGASAISTAVTSGGAGAVEAPPPLPISVPVSDPTISVPPIRVEPEAIRPPSGGETRGIREVVLPPSVVLAWSLLVLTALPTAFIAGLMVGHFLWKSGP